MARIAEALGDVCELAAWYDQAEESYARARQLSADVLAQARLMRKEGILRERLGSYPEALDWYMRGLEALDESGAADGAKSRVQLESQRRGSSTGRVTSRGS